jgi:lysophospholipase L1-like esterase
MKIGSVPIFVLAILSTGDSITEGLIEGVRDTERRYTTVLESSLAAAGCSSRVVNAGKGGETSAGGALRFPQDVSQADPDVVTILFGANDLLLSETGDPAVLPTHFGEALRFMVKEARSWDAVPVLLTLVPVIPEKYYSTHDRELYESAGGIESIRREYDSTVRRIAREEETAILDIEELFEDSLEISLGTDGAHPSARGHEMMGRALASLILGLELENDGGGAGPDPLGLCYAYPNPYRPEGGALVTAYVQVGRPGSVELLIWDASGRKVTSSPGVFLEEEGEHRFAWDGTSDGRTVAPGIYLLSLRWTSRSSGESSVKTLKVAVLR